MTRKLGTFLCLLTGALLLLVAAVTPILAENDTPVAGENDRTSSLQLTDNEKAWLAQHKTIRVAFDGYFPPYSTLNNDGQLEGLAVDIFQLMSGRLGIELEISPQVVWKDLYAAAQRREVDVVATMGDQPERHQWFVFTRPYIFKSLVIVTRKETTEITEVADLAGKTVALVKNYQYVKPLLEKNPGIIPLYVETMLDGLDAVSVGTADAVITFVGAGSYLKEKYQLSNLKNAVLFASDQFTESIAVRNDWPELRTILDKALRSLSEAELQEIRKRWLGPEIVPGISRRLVFTSLGMLLVLIIGGAVAFTLWNRALKKQVRLKTAELQQELDERIKVEGDLVAAEKRFRDVLENLQLIAVLLNEKGEVSFCNDYLAQLIGSPRETLLGSDWFERMIPAVDQEVKELFLRGLKNGEIEPCYENPITAADGTLRHILWNNTILRNAAGRVIGTASIGEDITERKQAERELEKHREHLEELVAAQTEDLQRTQQSLQFMLEDLNEANARLREVDQLKSMFIASMSHELRTPLNAVIGFSSILLNEWTGSLNEEQKQNAGAILRSGKHLLALINDVIDISKVEAGMLDVCYEDFDLAALLAELEQLFAQEAKDRGLSLSVQRLSLALHTDRRRLLQCLINLVSNALKYTEQGSVSVTAAYNAAAQRVTLNVSDTGIGIAAKDQPQLFQAFSRISSELGVRTPGTGLGLYLTKKISLDILRGNIGMMSEPGEGSTFSLSFPARMTEKS